MTAHDEATRAANAKLDDLICQMERGEVEIHAYGLTVLKQIRSTLYGVIGALARPAPDADVREAARELMRRLMLMTFEHHQRPFETRSREREVDEYAIAAALQAERERAAAAVAALTPFAMMNPHSPPTGVNPEQWSSDVNRASAAIRRVPR